MNDKRGVSAVELSKNIGVTYKIAWYLSEFCFRFNRRNMNLFERLIVAVGCSFLPD